MRTGVAKTRTRTRIAWVASTFPSGGRGSGEDDGSVWIQARNVNEKWAKSERTSKWKRLRRMATRNTFLRQPNSRPGVRKHGRDARLARGTASGDGVKRGRETTPVAWRGGTAEAVGNGLELFPPSWWASTLPRLRS